MSFYSSWGSSEVVDTTAGFFVKKIGSTEGGARYTGNYFVNSGTFVLSNGIVVYDVGSYEVVKLRTKPNDTESFYYARGTKPGEFYKIPTKQEVGRVAVSFCSSETTYLDGLKGKHPTLFQVLNSRPIDLIDWTRPQTIIGSYDFGDTIVTKGSAGATIHLGGGSNRAWGSAGSDTFTFSTTGDGDVTQIVGGGGADSAWFENRSGYAVINGGISGKAGGHKLFGIERIQTGSGDDNITMPEPDTLGMISPGYVPNMTVDATVSTHSGDDKVVGTSNRDYINLSVGNDYANGGKGDDILHGGSYNDRLDGGEGNDISVHDYQEKSNTIVTYLGDPTKVIAADKWQFRVAEPRDKRFADSVPEIDYLKNIERIVFYEQRGPFATEAVIEPLVKWHFVIDRKQDGFCTIKLYQNGKMVMDVKSEYDDATPIPLDPGNKFYEARYRPDGSLGKVIQFEKLGTPQRTEVQIHGGSTNGPQSGWSEGCFILLRPDMQKLRSIFDKAFEGTNIKAVAGLGYDLAMPITVDVRNEVKQPKISFAPDSTVSDARTAVYKVPLSMTDFGDLKGTSRKIDLFFKVDQDAGAAILGKDFVIEGAQSVGGNRYKVVLDANKTETSFRVKVLADAGGESAEKISFVIDDVNLYRDRPGTGWTLYEQSKDTLGSISRAESLLLGDKSITITIKADAKFTTEKLPIKFPVVSIGGTSGSDTFTFDVPIATTTKLGFGPGDSIALAQSVFAVRAKNDGSLVDLQFKDLARSKLDADDRILFDSRSGDLSYDADGSGSGTALLFAQLGSGVTLTAADIFIV